APDGGLALAYLAKRQGHGEYQLRVGPVAIDAATGVPRVEESDTVALADDRALHPPAFSPDGRWVYSITQAGDMPNCTERHSVAAALARRPPGSTAASGRATTPVPGNRGVSRLAIPGDRTPRRAAGSCSETL